MGFAPAAGAGHTAGDRARPAPGRRQTSEETAQAVTLQLGNRLVGPEHPCYIVAEIGQNHSGSIETAIRIMRAAKQAGVDAVKFQKRTPSLCVPESERSLPRETPWGVMTYLEYRERLEFSAEQYDLIHKTARLLGITWFASVWDEPSVELMLRYRPVALKIPSACLTDHSLLRACRDTGVPVILSTGMSTADEIADAIHVLDRGRLAVLHCNSAYPAPAGELNLRCIEMLRLAYPDLVVGFSGHELGIAMTLCAVVLGASIVERHVTLDRTWWGTDQAASLEPKGLETLVRDIRKWEAARGDGIKRVYDSERPSLKRLRRVPSRDG